MVKVIFSSPQECKLIEDMTVVDMHCHTNVSDGRDTPSDLINRAKKLGIGLSITDHNEIKASLKASKLLDFGIPGIEITSSDAMDFLVYFYKIGDLEHFYKKYIKDKKLSSKIFNLRKLKWTTEELLDHVVEYNCIVALPHPITMRPKNSYIYMHRNPQFMKYVDAIEVINSIMHQKSNEKSAEWAKELKKGVTGASDAHIVKHLGRAVTASYSENVGDFLDNIKKEKNVVVGRSLDTFLKLHAKAVILKRNLKW